MVQQDTIIEQVLDVGTESLINIKEKVIEFINGVINSITPEHPEALVFVMAFLIGSMLKKNYKQNWTFGLIAVVIVYGFLRFIGLGG